MAAESLRALIAPLAPSPYAAIARERLVEAAQRQSASDNLANIEADAPLWDFLTSALGDSPYLLDCAAKDIGDLRTIIDQPPQWIIDAEIAALAAASWDSRDTAMSALRLAKRRIALTLGLADLGQVFDLDTVTGTLTDFADAALAAALRFALADAERRGHWQGAPAGISGLAILAMGKYGAHELNYSSDIDIIAFFEARPGLLADGIEPAVFWVRIVRLLVTLLQDRTADGYVFRVDLRLRPDPGATAVAIGVPAALVYYESMGQNWERAALIKARAAAGDCDCGSRFLNEIRPFIWRRHLDFAAIHDIHSIKRQIHTHKGHGQVRVAGHDIKRGRGGIREIELFVQTQQLIAGGRDPGLRGRRTRVMLAELADRNWFGAAERDELDAAYVFFRNVEHRIQMLRDEQTHILPDNAEDRARVARLAGFGDLAAFDAEVEAHLTRVAARYSGLFGDTEPLATATGNLVFTGSDDDPDTLAALTDMGFTDPEAITRAVRAWHFGRYAATRSTRARENLTELTPALLQALAGAGDPDAAFRSFDTLLHGLPAGVQFISLIHTNRKLLDLLVYVLGAAPLLAEDFARRPHIVDALIDPAVLTEAFDRPQTAARLRAFLAESAGYEDLLDRARRFAAEQRFLIAIRLVTGAMAPPAAASAFSDLAELIISALLAAVQSEFAQIHGTVAGGRVAIVAFGRLGSREMTAASDLDLIVIYDFEAGAKESNGTKPLPAVQYFTRLTQRFVAALSSPTAEGVAYETDLRLRPSGRSGPVATQLSAFERYQREDAWTWEHMALTRARPVAGDPDLCRAVAEIIAEILSTDTDRSKLAADIRDMRAKVAAEKKPASAWDLKLSEGGLMDLEFIAQFLVLSGFSHRPGEAVPDLIARATDAGTLARADGDTLGRSARLQSALFQIIRAATGGDNNPEDTSPAFREFLARAAEAVLAPDSAKATPAAGRPPPADDQNLISPTGASKSSTPILASGLDDRLTDLQAQTRLVFDTVLQGQAPK